MRIDPRRINWTPSDLLVMGLLGVIALVGVAWLITAASQTYTRTVPARGGTYAEAVVGVPRFINPVLAVSDADRDLVALVYSGLMRVLPSGEIVPDLAESYTLSEDKRTYTFTLRADATFHDGTPVTADDVIETVLLAQNPAIKSPKRANWEGVEVSAPDQHTVAFTLSAPYAPFLDNTTLGILPKHIWGTVPDDEFQFSTFNTKPIGSGLYQIDRVLLSGSGVPEQVDLSAFDGIRTPNIESLQFHFFGTRKALEDALKKDNSLAAHSTITDSGSRVVHEAMLGRVFGVFYNQNHNELFADPAVRHALDAALDKSALVATLVGGYGTPLSGPLPPEGIAQAGTTTNLADAQTILTDDGWVAGDDGILTKTIKKQTRRLSFSLATGNAPELKSAAELVAKKWQELGVEVKIQYFEQNDLQQEVIRTRQYDALLFGEVIGRELDLFAFWHSSQRNDPGLNIALYVNAAVDKKLEAARATEDIEERRKLAEEAAEIISSEWAATFLYAPHFVFSTPAKVRGIELGSISIPADRFLNIGDWYTETERVWPIFDKNNN